MSSSLLRQFSTTVIDRLVERDLLLVVPGRRDAVVDHVAERLARVQRGSLISTLTDALVRCDDVEELFAEDDDVREIVDDMDRASAGLSIDPTA